MTKQLAIKAALKRISSQIPDSPEARLHMGIIEVAIRDLSDKEHKHSAKSYLMGEMVHAQLLGLEPGFIRSTLKELRLLRS